MKIWVGITDWDWYNFVRDNGLTEVNFWKPSGKSFKAINEGDLFLFKLKAARGGKIVGGGFFTGSSIMPIDWAWKAYERANGAASLGQLKDSVMRYRNDNPRTNANPDIGCIAVSSVFYFDEQDWFDAPGEWRAIVSGKTFSTDTAEGMQLYEQVKYRLQRTAEPKATSRRIIEGAISPEKSNIIELGSFKMNVADAYQRRCAISGERTMPALAATHIIPCNQGGLNEVANGVLLRSDMGALFDAGYITILPDRRIKVSQRIRSEFGNGDAYYAYQNKRLIVTPSDARKAPKRDYLEWHNDCVFIA